MQLTHAAETGSPAIQVEMIMDHAKSRDPYDPFPALSEDRFHLIASPARAISAEAGRRRAGEGHVGPGFVLTADIALNRALVAGTAEFARRAEAGWRRTGQGYVGPGACGQQISPSTSHSSAGSQTSP